jgi:hypothetical protein
MVRTQLAEEIFKGGLFHFACRMHVFGDSGSCRHNTANGRAPRCCRSFFPSDGEGEFLPWEHPLSSAPKSLGKILGKHEMAPKRPDFQDKIFANFFQSKISQTPCPEPFINDQLLNFTHSLPRRPNFNFLMPPKQSFRFPPTNYSSFPAY